jgi:hypothetical protein
MTSQSKSQSNSGFSRRFFLAGAAAGGAMIPVAAHAVPPKPRKRGVWKNSRGTPADDDNLVDRVTDFSYQSDVLAQLIVEIWGGHHPGLMPPTMMSARLTAAKQVLADRGIYLEQPIVLTELEYDNGFSLADNNLLSAVVFVVPDQSRATTGKPLLETAKLLMAVTPNGI